MFLCVMLIFSFSTSAVHKHGQMISDQYLSFSVKCEEKNEIY